MLMSLRKGFWSSFSLIVFSGLAFSGPPARAACDVSGLAAGSEVAELQTSLGVVCVELLRAAAPGHVDNFLYYLQGGLIDGTFFHRSEPGFVLQGGGFRVGAGGSYEAVPARGVVVTNEPCTPDTPAPPPATAGTQICSTRGNQRGTLALAKLGGDPNSGSTNWFFNLADNRSNLDNQNGGFTVFGRVLGNGMQVVDAIAALQLATKDDLLWVQSSLLNMQIPLRAPMVYSTPGFGCWDGSRQATVLDATALPNNPPPVADPYMSDIWFTVSAACGTPTDPVTFVANPGTPDCLDADRIAVGTTGPWSLNFSPSPAAYFALTCPQVREALAQRALWRSAFKAQFAQQLVFIESSALHVVPEPDAGLAAASALLCLGLLVRRRRRLTHAGVGARA